MKITACGGRLLFACAASTVMASVAMGTVTHSMVAVDNSSGDGDENDPTFSSSNHYTFDLIATISDSDDWSSTDVTATIEMEGLEFFQAAFGENGPPSKGLIAISPAVEYDSYYRSPGSAGGSPGFADGPDDTPTSLHAIWFDTGFSGDGPWQIQRMTIISPVPLSTEPGGELVATITGTTTTINGGGTLFPFDLELYVGADPCDVNQDGSIDVDDLTQVILDWGPCDEPPAKCPSDTDGNGSVDVDDLVCVILSWG